MLLSVKAENPNKSILSKSRSPEFFDSTPSVPCRDTSPKSAPQVSLSCL